MKRRTIKAACRKKIDQWLASIQDEKLRDLLKNNVIVTGGAVASMLLNQQVNDYDLYFRTKACAVAVANYYVSRFKPTNRHGINCNIFVQESEDRVGIVIKSAGIASEGGTDKPYDYFEAREAGAAGDFVSGVMDNPGVIEDAREEMEEKANQDDGLDYRPVFMSTHAITLSGRIQVVLRFFGEPDEIHKNYDFVHCTNYWTAWDNEIVLHPAALESLLSRELRYVGSRYPICSIIRLRKFIGRGWTVNAGQILKMVMQVSELDLTDASVLQDQLTGVDAAYFSEVIQRLKESDPEKINAAYLIEIIDRMF
jgi:hypothetical protein